MPDFSFPRFTERHSLVAPVPGEVVDLYADDTEVGVDDSVVIGDDLAPVTDLRVRFGLGVGRVYEVTS
jgi:hypothetical protein